MVKARKRKPVIDPQVAIDRIGEDLKAEQTRSHPKTLANDELFVEDNQPDNSQIHLPRRRKRATKEKRLTHAEAIIRGSNPLPFGVGGAYCKRKKKSSEATNIPARKALVVREVPIVAETDLWAARQPTEQWAEQRIVASRPKSTDAKNRPNMIAVEVDPAGCSYNPDHEHHQDAIAQAVAHENMKLIARELQPQALPDTVSAEELHMKEMGLELFNAEDEEEVDFCVMNHGGTGEVKLRARTLTRKDRARKLAHRQEMRLLQARKSLKSLRRQLENIKELKSEIEEESRGQALQAARRQADLETKATVQPPKLGRHRYEPLPVQVLATDDVSGCLRRLKTTPVIIKDRYKSLQKRGIIQVSVKQHWNKPTTRRVKLYEKRETREKHEQAQAQINRFRKKKAVKQT